MRLVLHLSGLVLVGLCATWAYRVNYATQQAGERVAALRAEIALEREAIAVLQAEWAYLNRPDRLRALIAAHAETLKLVDLQPEQFADITMVAFPPEPEQVEAAAGASTGADPAVPSEQPPEAVQ